MQNIGGPQDIKLTTMKTIIVSLILLISLHSNSQQVPKGWVRIYYVFDGNKQVAKRFCNDSIWVVDDPKIALEKMYQEKVKSDTKYELALAILKLLNPNGTPRDQKLYNIAVNRYNAYLQNNK